MKILFKTFVSVLVASAVLICCYFSSFAETYYTDKGFTFRETDYGVSIHSWDYSGDVLTVPQLLSSKRVTEIDDFAFSNDDKVEQIDFSKATYLRRIGKMAFNNSGLSGELLLTSSINEFGVGAFQNCSNLTKVQFKSNTKTISEQCFMNCTNLTDVDITSMVKEIGAYAFQNCTSLGEITIPKTVTSINSTAFSGCNNFTINCCKNSYAQQFAIDNGYDYFIIDDLIGDVDDSGVIDILDVTFIQKYRVGLKELDKHALNRADVNRDGQVTVRDATIIQMYLAQMTQDYIK